MLIQLFIILLVGAAGFFYLGLTMKKWILTMTSAVLFFVLAFSAFSIEVVTGGVNIVFEEIVLVLLMWVGGFAAAIFTLVGMTDFIRATMDKKKAAEYGGPPPRR